MGEITIFDALWMYTEDTKKKRCASQWCTRKRSLDWCRFFV